MKHSKNPYPTRSLREYLAYQSVHHTESEQEQPIDSYDSPRGKMEGSARMEVQVEVGDGRSQVIVVDQKTDIRREALQFCMKYQLEEYVSDLLAETIRDKYEMEREEAMSQSIAKQQHSLAEMHSNPHAREVLIADSQPETDRQSQNSRVEHSRKSRKEEKRQSSEKGASRILRGSQLRGKKYSMQEAYLLETKQNQPELNKMSLQICQKLGKENILQHCNQRSKEKYAAILRQRMAKEQEAMRQCPFQPQINPISKQVDIASSALTQTLPSRRFQRLYEEHRAMQQRREEQRQQLMQEMPFKPALNHISRKIVESKRANNDSQELYDRKPHNACSNIAANSLPHTGRAPRNRNTQNLPIGQYLYAQAMKKTKPRAPDQHTQVRALEHSEQLVAALKEKRINEVFDQLTQSPHEQLFCQDINTDQERFRTGRLRLFMPIFMEMSELGLSLTRSEFMQACLALLRTMSPEERHEVIFPREKNEPVLHSLPRSKSRQAIKRQQLNQEDLYNRGLQQRRIIEQKNEQRRESRAREQLKHCTFRPVIRHP